MFEPWLICDLFLSPLGGCQKKRPSPFWSWRSWQQEQAIIIKHKPEWFKCCQQSSLKSYKAEIIIHLNSELPEQPVPVDIFFSRQRPINVTIGIWWVWSRLVFLILFILIGWVAGASFHRAYWSNVNDFSVHSLLKRLSYDTRNGKQNFGPSFAVPLTASVPTNGGSSLDPGETEENNKMKYIIGISAAVLVVFVIVGGLYCLLRRRCDDRNIVNDPAGT